ncbi:uncharacterized protein B0I36DRAFT_29528 [Microdochium trichocladiopsis]|uniref:Uncharacterized protein n=1 Tax=Microdochium trichocladiopsis TaxID=1682393 RepID=A0A9P8XWF4_9PEZI|nr:uncharacterized protein B0I36DRAFT_29528 [Microdochium trichocladiopsis]KAH7021156.1 hypothetical protein B0I36DRAFT_29528 [Microdochium trichocladiopsis]
MDPDEEFPYFCPMAPDGGPLIIDSLDDLPFTFTTVPSVLPTFVPPGAVNSSSAPPTSTTWMTSSTSPSTSVSTPPTSSMWTTSSALASALPTPDPVVEALCPSDYKIQFYNEPTAEGCANEDCTTCAEDFHMYCSVIERDEHCNCACQWNSGCMSGAPERGMCCINQCSFLCFLIAWRGGN